jgi:pyruvate, water dikinase
MKASSQVQSGALSFLQSAGKKLVSMRTSWLRRANRNAGSADVSEDRLKRKYLAFRELLTLNNECLELISGLQEDLQFVVAERDIIGAPVSAIFEKAYGVVGALEALTGLRYAQLTDALNDQRSEVERYIAACQELVTPKLSAWLTEFGMNAISEVGGKAAALGEIKHRLGLPVPEGYVLTTAAYWQFCGKPLWQAIRDAIRGADVDNLEALHSISARLAQMIMVQPLPRAVEVAITERALALKTGELGLAVRSSAVGEGGEKTFAGQYLSLINVARDQVVEAYKQVIAGRFSSRALAYRLSTGLLEVESPMAVLFLPVIRARASGIMYTRDPGEAKARVLWVTSTKGLGMDVASGATPADLFIMSRKRPYAVVDRHLVSKDEEITALAGGGLQRRRLETAEARTPSVEERELRLLTEWGIRLEEHFGTPQDVEWAIDDERSLWILQSRPLALAESHRARRSKPRAQPVLSGGRTVFPGQVAGPACLVEDAQGLDKAPEGAVVFLRKASPEIAEILPRVAGLVAEWGNVTGHAAALLREFRVPSVFLMSGAFERLKTGDPVSLDAVQAKVYAGLLWETRRPGTGTQDLSRDRSGNPVSQRLLTLNLLDPSAFNFRPAGCKSTHDVLRFCHEKAIEAMFVVNDIELEQHQQRSRKLETTMPLHVYVLDLGGGTAPRNSDGGTVSPSEVISRPFQSLWRGLTHPTVSWKREMPASFSDLASVMAGSLSSHSSATRGFGERSYLLVADEYMNFNSRLAYHFSLVDACLSDTPSANYISFRFAGGGATRQRRGLRACFLEACLTHYGFHVDRRGDLLNAWFKKGSAEDTSANLDILGRLLVSSSQLDMFMSSQDVMRWYVQQFLAGNYSFQVPEQQEAAILAKKEVK